MLVLNDIFSDNFSFNPPKPIVIPAVNSTSLIARISAAIKRFFAMVCSAFSWKSKPLIDPLNNTPIKEKDPLNVTNEQCALAAYNIVSIAVENYAPNLAGPLLLCSMLAGASLNTQGGLKGQLKYWGGEALSLALKTGLSQYPTLKAAVDLYRVGAVTIPSLKAIGSSFYGLKTDTGKALKCAAVNAVIAGTSLYRIRDSLQHAFNLVGLNPSIPEGPTKPDAPNTPTKPDAPKPPIKPAITKRHITFGSTYVAGNKDRDGLSKLVDANHKEYADTWGMEYRTVTENLLKKQCTVNNERKDCSPYWNKIKVLKDWLDVPAVDKSKEEWYILADDDMVVGNMKIDPYAAIDQLRNGHDTSAIVAEDVFPYTGNFATSVNTGLLFFRKDLHGKKLLNEIWNKRNDRAPDPVSYCPTLGVCEKQHSLHEQQALSDIVKYNPKIVNKLISIVSPRDELSKIRGHLAVNTFERTGQFCQTIQGWEKKCEDFVGMDNHYPQNRWRPGDWMGQASGVPVLGRYCENNQPKGKVRPIRQEKIASMISTVIR